MPGDLPATPLSGPRLDRRYALVPLPAEKAPADPRSRSVMGSEWPGLPGEPSPAMPPLPRSASHSRSAPPDALSSSPRSKGRRQMRLPRVVERRYTATAHLSERAPAWDSGWAGSRVPPFGSQSSRDECGGAGCDWARPDAGQAAYRAAHQPVRAGSGPAAHSAGVACAAAGATIRTRDAMASCSWAQRDASIAEYPPASSGWAGTQLFRRPVASNGRVPTA